MLFFFLGCGNKNEIIALGERENLPKLKAYNVSTVVSDSGITRYRMNTKELIVFDKVPEPYLKFPKGIYIERFDEDYHIDAQLEADEAIFFEKTSIWKLNGKVKALNLQGETFETEELFWNQKEEKIYTDKFMKITQKSRIITGLGFESNQTLTRYIIRKPKGVIPLQGN
jgi:LPS export ABC transporter protein LptC